MGERKLIPILERIIIGLSFLIFQDDESENVTLESYVQKITLSEIGKMTIGHSMTATLVAEQIPHKIQCVVYLAAYYLKDGQSAYDINLKINLNKKSPSGSLTDDHYMKDEKLKSELYDDCS